MLGGHVPVDRYPFWTRPLPATSGRRGSPQIAMFFGIGVWLGFIVLDGGTYLLLVATLGVGLSLVPATAVTGANFTMSPNAKRSTFWLPAGTIFAEVIHLGVHYFIKTH